MYYDANGADYISTSSFAISDTGVLTINAWMKSNLNETTYQTLIADSNWSGVTGFIYLVRLNTNTLDYTYATGTAGTDSYFTNFFQNLDNQ
ncbi:MAG: hypothetical protein WC483_06780 [Candidatus Paceibacterota bacterium]|nr:hypothetical protein [Candidatus Paceibacterota bacterium]